MKNSVLIAYDTRDGEILNISNVISGEITFDAIQKYEQEIIKKYGSMENMKITSLDSSKYGMQLLTYNYHRIVNGELYSVNKHPKYRMPIKDSTNDRSFPLFENLYNLYDESTNTINIELLDFFFNDYMNFNLYNACKVLPILWLEPHEIERFDYSNEKYVVKWDSDVYPSLEDFTKEILDYGFMFPLIVRPKNENGIYTIFDGSHRIKCAKILSEKNLWNRRILCLEASETDLKYIDKDYINYELKESIKMHIPKKVIDKYSYISFNNKTDFNEYVYEVEIHRYLDLVMMLRMYVFELTRTLQKYRKIYGKPYKTYQFINNEEEFYKWIKEEKDV